MAQSFTTAILRKPGPNFKNGITKSELGEPDINVALSQHKHYSEILQECGLNVKILDYHPDFPDASFVEDTAIITPQCAIITNPGDKRRRGEEVEIERVLRDYRKIEAIQPPGTVDGGDVLQIGNEIYIGLSKRTNDEGARQLSDILRKYNIRSFMVRIKDVLHLKSGINYLGGKKIIIYQDWYNIPAFSKYERIPVLLEESYAANCLYINGSVLIPAGFPDTHNKLEKLGSKIIELEMSEFRKMDGGLTCLSLRF